MAKKQSKLSTFLVLTLLVWFVLLVRRQ
ncbi:hypothetical protein [Burkholderia phage FLC9]|nr:hypothetical protein [Burkholderia phage FLC9]